MPFPILPEAEDYFAALISLVPLCCLFPFVLSFVAGLFFVVFFFPLFLTVLSRRFSFPFELEGAVFFFPVG